MSIETSFLGTAGFFRRNWWVLLLRGLVAIALGILVFTRPAWTLAAVMLAFGVYALVEGSSDLFAAIIGWRHRDDCWLLLLEAFIGIGIGVVTLRTPGLTAIVVIFFIAAWALATGVLRIVEGTAPAAGDPGRDMAGAWRSVLGDFRTTGDDAAVGRCSRIGPRDRRIRAHPGHDRGPAGLQSPQRTIHRPPRNVGAFV